MRAKTAITTPFESAARTATASSDKDHTVENFDEGTLHVDVTAINGTPTLAVSYEVSPDDGATWFTHTTGSSITAVGKQIIQLTSLGKTYRVTGTFTAGGASPSFTYSVKLVLKRRA